MPGLLSLRIIRWAQYLWLFKLHFCLSVTQVFIRIQDSNDNPPVFSQPAYDVSVSEDVPVDMELLRVRASDMDERARLSFSIYGSVDPASMRLFRVNPGTGVVYTADRLDYEARTQHILTIMVRMEIWKKYICVCGCAWFGCYHKSMCVPALSFKWCSSWQLCLPHLILADFFHLSPPAMLSIFISRFAPGQGSRVSI